MIFRAPFSWTPGSISMTSGPILLPADWNYQFYLFDHRQKTWHSFAKTSTFHKNGSLNKKMISQKVQIALLSLRPSGEILIVPSQCH